MAKIWDYLLKSGIICFMILGFKTEWHPTNQQKTLLAKHAGVARHAYNWGLWLTRTGLTQANWEIRFLVDIYVLKTMIYCQNLVSLRKSCRNILTHNSNNPDSKLKFPTAIYLHKLLVAIVKPNNYCYYEVSKTAPQYALRHLSNGWKRCFSKVSGYLDLRKKVKTIASL